MIQRSLALMKTSKKRTLGYHFGEIDDANLGALGHVSSLGNLNIIFIIFSNLFEPLKPPPHTAVWR